MGLATLGYLMGIDMLFWAWAIVTVLAFLFVIFPNPATPILIFISFVLLFIMALRGIANLFNTIYGYISNPLVVAFLITMVALFIGKKLYDRSKKVKKK